MAYHHALPPDLTAVVADGRGVQVVTPDGELLSDLPPRTNAVLLCHARYMAGRLGRLPDVPVYDVLELYAICCPTRFCAPSPFGLAQALNLPKNAPDLLHQIATELLSTQLPPRALQIVDAMTYWPWRRAVLEANNYASTYDKNATSAARPFAVWEELPELSAALPRLPEGQVQTLNGEAARKHLAHILIRQREQGRARTRRALQENYVTRVAAAFDKDGPKSVLAEAGTGVGKTLGYLAPAHAFAEQNGAQVWLSTYTRNLQRQIEAELETLYPDKTERAIKAVVRKGRENYLCLLNFQEFAGQAAFTSIDTRASINAGMLARWVMETRDGDISGSDFPGWLPGLMGIDIGQLADRRGECIYAGCDHFDRCFVERSRRRASRASLVIANHAVVMLEAAMAGEEDAMPGRYVFDEGHHLFEAADSAFAVEMTLSSMAELRRWILGPEGGLARKRGRALSTRLEGMVEQDERAVAALKDTLRAARELPVQGAMVRIMRGDAHGAIEQVFGRWRDSMAMTPDAPAHYTLEREPDLWGATMADDFDVLAERLKALHRPMQILAQRLMALRNEDADLDPITQDRMLALAQSVDRRVRHEIAAWIEVCDAYAGGSGQREDCIDWLELTRDGGQDRDVGIHRRYKNPMALFAEVLRPHMRGMVVTSATLRDGAANDDDEGAWADAESRCGLDHMGASIPERVAIASPFDYAAQSRVLIVTDVPKTAADPVAHAYDTLFQAAGGGALGLFTAIHRLKQVQARLKQSLPYTLYAQHTDGMDVGTLVDLFRVDEDSCLLGTDAVRDGVDVPGRSLRLLVMDRIPWSRPSILHKARRAASNNPRAYDTRLARLRLKQAFGRLIRSESDKGVFVLLEQSLPHDLVSAFPPDVAIERVTLDEAAEKVRGFLSGGL